MYKLNCVGFPHTHTHDDQTVLSDTPSNSTEVNLSQREQLFGGHLVVCVCVCACLLG